jgi:hypothetical protein
LRLETGDSWKCGGEKVVAMAIAMAIKNKVGRRQ